MSASVIRPWRSSSVATVWTISPEGPSRRHVIPSCHTPPAGEGGRIGVGGEDRTELGPQEVGGQRDFLLEEVRRHPRLQPAAAGCAHRRPARGARRRWGSATPGPGGGAEGTGGFFVQAGRIMGILAWRFCTAPRILGCDPGRIFIIFEPSCTWL